MDALENDTDDSLPRSPINSATRRMTLETIQKLMANARADYYFNALPSAESMTWITPSVDVDGSPSLLIGSVGNHNILAYLLLRGDASGVWEVRYCLKPIGDNRATSKLPLITCDEAMTKPLIAPFKYFADGTKMKKRMLSMLIRYYFLLEGHISKIDAWNADFSRRLANVLRKIYEGPPGGIETHNGSQEQGETVEESSEPEDEESTYGLRPTNRNDVANVPKSNATETQSPQVESHHRSHDLNSDLHRLLAYLSEHDALHLLENIPDAEDMKFVDQTYILEAQPKKLFTGSHAKSGDAIYAYMVRIQMRGFHEIRFYVESARGSKTLMPAEAVGKQRILHPLSKTYPKSTGPSEQVDKARLTLMVKWYFIAAGIAESVLQETKAYPERLRSALEYIAEAMGPAAVKASEVVPTDDSMPDERSESSYTPDETDIQSTLAAEPTPKPPRFPQSVARKSAPSLPRRAMPQSTTSQQPISKTATPAAAPQSAKRSAEDEDDEQEWEALCNLVQKQHVLTKEINVVEHELEVMDAQFEAYQEKWKRDRAELAKRRDEIQERRSAVRNMFKKRRTLDTNGD